MRNMLFLWSFLFVSVCKYICMYVHKLTVVFVCMFVSSGNDKQIWAKQSKWNDNIPPLNPSALIMYRVSFI